MKFLKKFTKIDAAWALFPLVLMLSSCETMSLPSLQSKEKVAAGIQEAPIFVVMSESAPFYLEGSSRGKRTDKGHPFLYLPKGTLVKLLKNEVPYCDVLLTNGMKGWMPISNLAPQMATADGPASNVEPIAGEQGAAPAPSIKPERGVQLPTY